jgi:RHS repeat-associated protein
VSWIYLHQGGRYDKDLSLYSFRNRVLDATLGRWISQDPAGYVDGANLYAYVNDNPASMVDPSGLEGDWVAVPAPVMISGGGGDGGNRSVDPRSGRLGRPINPPGGPPDAIAWGIDLADVPPRQPKGPVPKPKGPMQASNNSIGSDAKGEDQYQESYAAQQNSRKKGRPSIKEVKKSDDDDDEWSDLKKRPKANSINSVKMSEQRADHENNTQRSQPAPKWMNWRQRFKWWNGYRVDALSGQWYLPGVDPVPSSVNSALRAGSNLFDAFTPGKSIEEPLLPVTEP